MPVPASAPSLKPVGKPELHKEVLMLSLRGVRSHSGEAWIGSPGRWREKG